MSSDKPKSQNQAPQYDYEALESTYAGWLKEAEDRRDKSRSSTLARLSASGLKKDSELWLQNMESVEAAYRKNLTELEGTETYRLIQENNARIAEEERLRQEALTREAARQADPYYEANELFENSQASAGDERAMLEVAALVPGANVSGSVQQQANAGDARAISILEQQAKESNRGYYFLGGAKIDLNVSNRP